MKINWKKIGENLKINKTKIWIFVIILIVGVLLQWWDYSTNCLKLICEPIALGIFYYVVWLIELINLWVVSWLTPIRALLFIDRVIVIQLQVLYWHVISCLIAIPLDKYFSSATFKRAEKEKQLEKEMHEKIQKDVEEAEVLEKEKSLKKHMLKIKKKL